MVTEYVEWDETIRVKACEQMLQDIACSPWLDEGKELDRLLVRIFEDDNHLAMELFSFLIGVEKDDLPAIITTFYCREAEDPDNEDF